MIALRRLDSFQSSVEINLPVSKSISNRMLIIGAISKIDLSTINISAADDSQILMQALRSKEEEINCGYGGTTLRFLLAYFSAIPGNKIVLTGEPELAKRPLEPLIDALRKLGATIRLKDNGERLDIQIKGAKLEGGCIKMDTSVSSQFVSALMMITPCMRNALEIQLKGNKVSFPYITMTAELMRKNGVSVEIDKDVIRVPNTGYRFITAYDEYDWSSAAFWYQIACFFPGTEVYLKGLREDSLQADRKVVEFFGKFGVESVFDPGGVRVRGKEISWIEKMEFNCFDTPDLVPSLAVTTAILCNHTVIKGVGHLQYKESNRLLALQTELEKFNVSVKIDGEELHILGNIKTNSESVQTVRTYKDHRIAMAFAPLVLKTGHLQIEDHEVVNKSYPEYWEELKKIKFLRQTIK